MARNRHIQIRLTDEEMAEIKKRAGDIKTSTFLRQLALEQSIPQPKQRPKFVFYKADPELVRAINRIGININQIAKQTNTGQEVGNAVLMALLNLQTTLDKALASSMPDDR